MAEVVFGAKPKNPNDDFKNEVIEMSGMLTPTVQMFFNKYSSVPQIIKVKELMERTVNFCIELATIDFDVFPSTLNLKRWYDEFNEAKRTILSYITNAVNSPPAIENLLMVINKLIPLCDNIFKELLPLISYGILQKVNLGQGLVNLSEKAAQIELLYNNLTNSISDEDTKVNDINAKISKLETTLSNNTKAVDAYLSYQSASEHWKNRVKWSVNSMWISGLSFLAISVSAGFLSYFLSGYIVLNKVSEIVQDRASLSYLASIVSVDILALWALRIVSKIFISSYHGFRDYSDRVVLVNTWFSLLRDKGDLLNGSEITRIVFSTLFRPGATGVGTEDVSPTGPLFEIVNKAVGGGNGNASRS